METDGYTKGYYNIYQKSSDNIGQVEQIVMLYDGAVNFIRQAKEAIVEENFEKRYNLINKAIAIITGLNSCLNFTDETRETATALDEFYQMIDMRLLYIQCDDSLDACDGVIADLKRMREAWVRVAEQVAADKTHEEPQLSTDEKLDAALDEVVQDSVTITKKDVVETSGSNEAVIYGTELHIDA